MEQTKWEMKMRRGWTTKFVTGKWISHLFILFLPVTDITTNLFSSYPIDIANKLVYIKKQSRLLSPPLNPPNTGSPTTLKLYYKQVKPPQTHKKKILQ